MVGFGLMIQENLYILASLTYTQYLCPSIFSLLTQNKLLHFISHHLSLFVFVCLSVYLLVCLPTCVGVCVHVCVIACLRVSKWETKY